MLPCVFHLGQPDLSASTPPQDPPSTLIMFHVGRNISTSIFSVDLALQKSIMLRNSVRNALAHQQFNLTHFCGIVLSDLFFELLLAF